MDWKSLKSETSYAHESTVGFADSCLQADVMSRVQAVHFMRRVFQPTVVAACTMLASIAISFEIISVSHVVANMSHLATMTLWVSYVMAAFIHTSLVVQMLLLVGGASFMWLSFDILKNIRGFSIRMRVAKVVAV